jgi:nicotinamide-nucleotide amidase
MKAEIISIGDELLIGQTINTNASWLGQECSQAGIRVIQVTTISDNADLIKEAINNAVKKSDLIIITGGLGPTTDDITKATLCEYFNTELQIHLPTLQRIEEFFSKRNRPMLEVNIRQAELPRSCEILENVNGTAAGMWFDHNGKVIVSLPGVPYEMKGIMTNEVFPRLTKRFTLKGIYHKTMLTQGLGESFLAEQIKSWEKEVIEQGFGLAYLPSPGMVKLRLTSYEGKSREEEIKAYFKVLEDRMPQFIYGFDNDDLASVLGKILRNQKLTIGTVESCTGGAIAAKITSISGASDYFKGSLITYSNELKEKFAQVNPDTLQKFGAVSQEVVEEMAEKGRVELDVDVCISVSGIAGPDGGTTEKPVGTVWIAISTKNRVYSKKFIFGDDRERNIQMSVLTALNLARCEFLGFLSEKK